MLAMTSCCRTRFAHWEIFARDLACRRNIVAGGGGKSIHVYCFPPGPQGGNSFSPKTSRSCVDDTPTAPMDAGMWAKPTRSCVYAEERRGRRLSFIFSLGGLRVGKLSRPRLREAASMFFDAGMRPKTSISCVYDSPIASMDTDMWASKAWWEGGSPEIAFYVVPPVASP